jgi:hypothetical protein
MSVMRSADCIVLATEMAQNSPLVGFHRRPLQSLAMRSIIDVAPDLVTSPPRHLPGRE